MQEIYRNIRKPAKTIPSPPAGRCFFINGPLAG
jgi:hypothetical protein